MNEREFRGDIDPVAVQGIVSYHIAQVQHRFVPKP